MRTFLLRLLLVQLVLTPALLAATDVWSLRFPSLQYRSSSWTEVVDDLQTRLASAAPEITLDADLPGALPLVRCDLRHIALPDALDALCHSSGLRWELSGTTLRIQAGALQPRARLRRIADTAALREALSNQLIPQLHAGESTLDELLAPLLLPRLGYLLHPEFTETLALNETRSTSLALLIQLLEKRDCVAGVIDARNILVMPATSPQTALPSLLAPLPRPSTSDGAMIRNACIEWLVKAPTKTFETEAFGEQDRGPETARAAMDRMLKICGELLAQVDAIRVDTNIILHLAFQGPRPLRDPLLSGIQRNLDQYDSHLQDLLAAQIRQQKALRDSQGGYPAPNLENIRRDYPAVDALKAAIRENTLIAPAQVDSNTTAWVAQFRPESDEAQEIYHVVDGRRHGLSYTLPGRNRRILWEVQFAQGKRIGKTLPIPWTGRSDKQQTAQGRTEKIYDDLNVLRIERSDVDEAHEMQWHLLPRLIHRRVWTGDTLETIELIRKKAK